MPVTLLILEKHYASAFRLLVLLHHRFVFDIQIYFGTVQGLPDGIPCRLLQYHCPVHAGDDHCLDNISLTVNTGEVLLLCGASGSGKTSVIRLINGLIPHYYHGDMTGNVIVNNRDIAKTELYQLAGIAGTVFQNPRSQFFSVDTDGEIVFGLENIGLDPKEIISRTEMIAKQMKLDS